MLHDAPHASEDALRDAKGPCAALPRPPLRLPAERLRQRFRRARAPRPRAAPALLPARVSEVTPWLLIPQGTIRSKSARVRHRTLSAKPCAVTQWSTRTPIAQTFASPSHTPVSPSRRDPVRP